MNKWERISKYTVAPMAKDKKQTVAPVGDVRSVVFLINPGKELFQ